MVLYYYLPFVFRYGSDFWKKNKINQKKSLLGVMYHPSQFPVNTPLVEMYPIVLSIHFIRAYIPHGSQYYSDILTLGSSPQYG